ncbi:hypothetical protein J3454_08635 [Erythrobacter sp. NFXS35]|uniref:hypothetical protein n=1 Tax=Erythrobacter sp. NFXS35 TaxID=2818436 RepID=UPI0032E0464D
MNGFHLLLAFVAGVAIPARAAACEISIAAPGSVQFEGESGQGYDSFTALQFETDFIVILENRGAEPCDGLASFRVPGALIRLLDTGGASLTYEILGPTNTNSVITPAGDPIDRTEAVLLQLASGQSQQLAFRFRVPAQQIVPAGTYSQSAVIEFVETDDAGLPVERSLEFIARVRSSMTLMLFDNSVTRGAGDGRSAVLDFDVLETGEQLSLSLLVVSNDPYTVDFLSEHAGRLAHSVLGDAHVIPYQLTLDGAPIPLGPAPAGTARREPTPAGGNQSRIAVRIGEVGLARAGTYEDVITVSIQPD